jgi:hypothetical protein
VNFPFICSNIPAAPAYEVYISQLIRYSRACGSYQDFLDRGLLLIRKLLNQGFLSVKLKSSLRKSYGRHHDLVDRYGISVSQMTMDMLHLSQTLPSPFLIHDITRFVTRLTRRAPLMEQELFTFPEHLSSSPILSGVRVTRSLALCICFVYRCLSFCTFFFWPMCCLFFDIRILITILVSSNSFF